MYVTHCPIVIYSSAICGLAMSKGKKTVALNKAMSKNLRFYIEVKVNVVWGSHRDIRNTS